ncbi:MAG: hypothetical protein AB1489_40295 [Acidobacteriota bacterium]
MKIYFTKLITSAVIIGSILFSGMAMAQTPYYRSNQYDNYRACYNTQRRSIGERLQNQKSRIAEGQRDGSLTRREADRLWRKHASLERELVLSSRVGYLTPQQYNHFHFELDQMSQVIYNAKHNYKNRYDRYDNGWDYYGSRR